MQTNGLTKTELIVRPKTELAIKPHRTYYRFIPEQDWKTVKEAVKYGRLDTAKCSWEEATLIGSQIEGSDWPQGSGTGLHMPMFDVDDSSNLNDFTRYLGILYGVSNVKVFPSRTIGHVHIYLEETIWTWDWAIDCLRILVGHGWIDAKWAATCIDQGQMFLRKGTIK